MSQITIKRGDNTELAPFFKASEFFTKEPTAAASHNFFSELVEAVSYLRVYYDVPWRITSTYRPDSLGSQHRECRAVDSQDYKSGGGVGSGVMLDLVSQLLNPSSEVFVHLRRLGITGFGVYDSFVHLDCRDVTKYAAAHQDRFGRFGFWDLRTPAVKKKNPGSYDKGHPDDYEENETGFTALAFKVLAALLAWSVFV